MKKKILSLLLVFVMSVILIPNMPLRVEASMTEEEFASKIVELQNTFIDGQYWNSLNYEGTVTTKGCPHTGCCGHDSDAYKKSNGVSCGAFIYNGQEIAWQCQGYALKLGYMIFGSVATRSWTNHKNAYNVYAGDVIRMTSGSYYHTIFVYKVVGDTLYYTDCNGSGPCMVKWGKTISKATLASKLVYVLHNPSYSFTGTGKAESKTEPIHTNTNANVRSGIFTLKNASSGRFMNVYGGKDANGTKVTMWEYDDSTDEQFNVVHKGDGKYKLYAISSSGGTNRVVDIYRNGASPAAGQVVDLWTPDDDIAQYFYIVPLDDDTYVFELAAKDGYVIAPTSASAANTNGSQLTLQKYTGESYQKWKFCNNNGKETYPVGSYSPDNYVVNTEGPTLTLRSSASGNASKVTSIPDKTVLKVTQVNGNWGYTTYNGYSGWVCLDYTVYSPSITGISVENMITSYTVGDEIDLSGVTVTVKYSNDSTKTITSGYSTEYDFSTAGEKTVTVKYEGFTATFNVTVEEVGHAKVGASAQSSAKLGETVNFSVKLEDAEKVYDGNFNIVYDSTKLKYKSHTVGSALKNQNCVVNPSYGENTIRVTFAGTGEIAKGEMINVSFEVVKADNSASVIKIENAEMYNIQGRKIDVGFSASSTSVTLKKAVTATGKVSLESVSGSLGENVTIPVKIAENPGIAGFKFKINYDKSTLVPVSIEKGTVLNAGTLTSNIQQSGDLASLDYVSAFWSNPANVTANGEILRVTFKISENAKEGTYPVTISYETGDVTNQNYDDVELATENGSVKVTNVVAGDVFKDGKVNTKDSVRLNQYLADWNVELSDYEKSAADVFKDGKINTKDSVKLNQYLADWNVELTSLFGAEEKEITFAASSAKVNDGYVDVPVKITKNDGVAGFKIKVNYDKSRLTPVSVTKGEALTSGTMTTNVDQGGNLENLKAVSVFWSNPSDVTATGVAFVVKFKVIDKENDIPITLEYEEGDICDQNYNDLIVTIVNGKVENAVSKKYDYTVKSLTGEMKNGKFYAEATIVKNTDRNNKDTIVIAVYKNGELTDMVYMKAVVEKGQTVEFGGIVTGDDGATLKAFVWDSLTEMTPLSNTVTK